MNQKIEVESAGAVSPHNQALYEAGKNMLVESINIGADFCKFMTTTTIGAIPTYLALLKLVLPKNYVLKSYDDFLFFLPAALLLVSTIVFVIGYFPQKGTLSLDLPAEIERERSATINHRQRYATCGFLVFSIAVVLAIWICVNAILSGKGMQQ